MNTANNVWKTIKVPITDKLMTGIEPYDINMIDYKDSSYFDNLQRKMGWGRRGN